MPSPSFHLAGRRALVTGSSPGIGRAPAAPAGRWGLADDLTGACVFLASPAADFINGGILTVDGGLSAVI